MFWRAEGEGIGLGVPPLVEIFCNIFHVDDSINLCSFNPATWTETQYNLTRFLSTKLYEALRSSTTEVLVKIEEEYNEKEFREYMYWAKINEHKLSSPSGRYVELYKALVIAVTGPEIKDKQRAMMEVIRWLSNDKQVHIGTMATCIRCYASQEA